MTNRCSNIALRGRIGSALLVLLALALSCSSSRKKGTREEDAGQDENEASVVTSTDSKVEEIKSDAKDFSDVDRPSDGSTGAQPDAKKEPSDGDASELPKTELDYFSDKIRVAEGEQAETLRELRLRFLAGEISDSYSPPSVMQGIPILQSDGTGYELFMRDATRYEDENGILILP